MLGNFPQAFSCVALINTAYNLAEAYRVGEGPSPSCVRRARRVLATATTWPIRGYGGPVPTLVGTVMADMVHGHGARSDYPTDVVREPLNSRPAEAVNHRGLAFRRTFPLPTSGFGRAFDCLIKQSCSREEVR